MGSLEDEELFYFIELDSTSSSSISMKSSTPISQDHQKVIFDLRDILWRETEDEVEVLAKIVMYLSNVGCENEEISTLNKWVVMRLKMDGYEAFLCKTSVFGSPKGDYEYIEVMIMNDKNGGNSTRLIVDMDFRSQFELARPTSSYKELMNNLPSIFVGTEEKLVKTISLLCSAAKESLKERGLHIPPWRQTSYMQSKWLSKDCKRVSFLPNMEFGMNGSEEERDCHVQS